MKHLYEGDIDDGGAVDPHEPTRIEPAFELGDLIHGVLAAVACRERQLVLGARRARSVHPKDARTGLQQTHEIGKRRARVLRAQVRHQNRRPDEDDDNECSGDLSQCVSIHGTAS
jgi:hypothetical protein